MNILEHLPCFILGSPKKQVLRQGLESNLGTNLSVNWEGFKIIQEVKGTQVGDFLSETGEEKGTSDMCLTEPATIMDDWSLILLGKFCKLVQDTSGSKELDLPEYQRNWDIYTLTGRGGSGRE